MLIEPEALLMFARRAGIDIYRHPDGKTMLMQITPRLTEEWKAVLRQNKAALMPLIPEAPAGLVGKPTKATATPTRENLDLFGPVPEQPKRPPKVGGRAKATREDKASA